MPPLWRNWFFFSSFDKQIEWSKSLSKRWGFFPGSQIFIGLFFSFGQFFCFTFLGHYTAVCSLLNLSRPHVENYPSSHTWLPVLSCLCLFMHGGKAQVQGEPSAPRSRASPAGMSCPSPSQQGALTLEAIRMHFV